MEFRGQLEVVRHRFWLIAACVLLAGITAYVVSASLPKTYTGTVTLIVGQSLTATNPDPNALLASQRLSVTYATVATTGPVLQKVIDSLQLSITVDELRDRVRASAPANNTLIYISADYGDPSGAAAIANRVADQLIAVSPTIQGHQADVQTFVDGQLTSTQQQLQGIQAEIDQLTVLGTRTPEQEQQLQTDEARLITLRSAYSSLLQFSSNSAANLLSVVDPAIAPTSPSGPRVLLNTLLAAMVGLLIALGVAFLLEYMDDTVKSPEDVREVAGVAALGAIVQLRLDKGRQYALTALQEPRAPATEAFRTLRTNLEFASVDAPLRTILVTSSLPSEGKTTVAANLAVVFAQTGKRVILLDADLRRPGVHRVFDLPNAFGLTNLLRAEELTVDSVAQSVPEENLRVITSGALPPNPAELLGSNRMQELIKRVVAEADVVIVDSPPLQVVTDAAILASHLDGTLLVIGSGRTRKGSVRQARETLDRAGAHILGAVVNRLSERAGTYYYYRYYGNYDNTVATGSADRPVHS